MSDVIQTERPRPGILLIRMNRPEALNAMNAELIEALHGVLAEVRHDSQVRAIVLTGNGRAFCAGLDLRGYGTPLGAAEQEGRPQAGLRVEQHRALVAPPRISRWPMCAGCPRTTTWNARPRGSSRWWRCTRAAWGPRGQFPQRRVRADGLG